jgi:acetyltransferase-like isoleucine patch superfamily enzyme
LDDSADKLVLGVGSSVGTNGILTLDDDSVTIGDGAAVDSKIVFDGNAQDFYVGLDDSADDLVIGHGSTVGTNPAIEIDENQDIKFAQSIGVGQAASSTTGDIRAQTMSLLGTTPTLTLGDGGEEDVKIQFNGVKDFYIANDDSADKLVIGEGSTVGTNSILTITDDTVTLGDGAAVDTALIFDGNAQDFYVALDDSADDLLIGNGSTVGSNIAIGINASQVVKFNDAYTFPTSDGSANQVLQTNGSGALSFAASPTSTAISDADGDTKVQVEESSDEDKIRFDTGGTERASIIGEGLLVGQGFSGGMFENEACNIRKTGNNDDAVLALDSDTGDASFYRFMRFYRKNANSSLAKLDYDLSGDSISLAVESDERYKTITGPADGWNLISKLEPIKYTRPSEGVTNGCGFGAQSYKQAFDDIGEYARGVTEGSDTEKWMLDYSVLVPNLVKTIQELEARIATLEGS